MDTASETPTASSTYSTAMRQQYDAEIRNAPQDLLATFNNAVRGLSRGVVQFRHPFEAKLHDIWYLLIEAAKHTDASSSLQDSLVVQTLMARQLADVGTQTSAGQNLWIDLPFLGADLEIAWHDLHNIHHGSDDDDDDNEDNTRLEFKRNLVAFMARLFATCDGPTALQDSLAACALEAFKNTLENQRTPDQLTSMLPIINMWLQPAARKLAIFSSEQKQLSSAIPLGPLVEARSEGAPGAGFSPARWRHWTSRIKELAGSEDDEVKKLAQAAGYWINEWMQTLNRAVTESLY
ncbi:hypothetical protein F5B17DRAFT_448946 [Nemania serpens]|nr:hypothetical protein F5B17DRAFT_448946 [Nemania serpens]